jgi:hypothetical protein
MGKSEEMKIRISSALILSHLLSSSYVRTLKTMTSKITQPETLVSLIRLNFTLAM